VSSLCAFCGVGTAVEIIMIATEALVVTSKATDVQCCH